MKLLWNTFAQLFATVVLLETGKHVYSFWPPYPLAGSSGKGATLLMRSVTLQPYNTDRLCLGEEILDGQPLRLS